MAVMNAPGIDVRLIDASGSGVMSRYDLVCIHTIVGRDPANAAHFSTGGYGEGTQSRDTRFRSAANLNGNYRIIAIENEDISAPFPPWNTADGHAVPSFTSAQMETIARILAWCHRTHGIPLQFVTDSRPTTRGVVFHRAGCDGNFAGYAFGGRVSGGELWSSSVGKVCPGDRRIFQLRDIIIPRARVLTGLSAPTILGGLLMALSDEQQTQVYNAIMGMNDVLGAFYAQRAANQGDQNSYLLGNAVYAIDMGVRSLLDDEAKVTAAIAAARGEVLTKVADLADDEAHIIGALRDPDNPANVELVTRILAGVTTLLEADQDPEIVVTAEHVQAIAEAVAGAVPEHLRPVVGQEIARVLTRGTEEYPPAPAE